MQFVVTLFISFQLEWNIPEFKRLISEIKIYGKATNRITRLLFRKDNFNYASWNPYNGSMDWSKVRLSLHFWYFSSCVSESLNIS